jgi:hypothetical protein
MADMTRHLKPWLTLKALASMGGDFEGVIASVTDETLRNPFTAQRTLEPVVMFLDGHRLVLNKSMLQACIGWWGKESNDWIGRRVRIYQRRSETTNQQGGTRTRWQRAIACEDHHARVLLRASTPVNAIADADRGREPSEDDDEPALRRGQSR